MARVLSGVGVELQVQDCTTHRCPCSPPCALTERGHPQHSVGLGGVRLRARLLHL